MWGSTMYVSSYQSRTSLLKEGRVLQMKENDKKLKKEMEKQAMREMQNIIKDTWNEYRKLQERYRAFTGREYEWLR